MVILTRGKKSQSLKFQLFLKSEAHRHNNLEISFLLPEQKSAISLFSELSQGLLKIDICKKEMATSKKNYNSQHLPY